MSQSRITFQSVTKYNQLAAVKIQNSLFPEYDATETYRQSLNKENNCRYWIVSMDGKDAGISGIYENDAEPESAWLGWFGILPEYREKKIGTATLKFFEEEAKRLGKKYVRAYTNRNDNDIAKDFYKANGYEEEYYNDEISIFSKSICDEQVPKWGNKKLRY